MKYVFIMQRYIAIYSRLFIRFLLHCLAACCSRYRVQCEERNGIFHNFASTYFDLMRLSFIAMIILQYLFMCIQISSTYLIIQTVQKLCLSCLSVLPKICILYMHVICFSVIIAIAYHIYNDIRNIVNVVHGIYHQIAWI